MSNQAKTKVLCYVDNYEGRDVEIVLPLIIFMKKHLNCEVEYVLIYDIHAIYRKKPDFVLIASIYGSLFNYRITKYAYDQNIKVFSLFSEGNIKTDGVANYFGNNPIREFFQEYVCCWNQRVRDYLRERHPEDKERIFVTGATGFDRYSILPKNRDQALLDELGVGQFKKVITYAGWGFAKLVNPTRSKELLKALGGDQAKFEQIREHRDAVEQALRDAIEKNPDTLFLLKKHPQETMPSDPIDERNEMSELANYPNVVYIKKTVHISRLLSVSDLWLAYDSTTALEAWLTNKQMPTIFIQPEDLIIYQSGLGKGCLLAQNSNELLNYIDTYFEKGKLEGFFDNALLEARKERISDFIGFDDGANHLRTASYFKKALDEFKATPKDHKYQRNTKYFIMYIAMKYGKIFYSRRLFSKLPKFKKTLWIFERNKLWKIDELEKKYLPHFEAYYQQDDKLSKFENGEYLNKD
ncbi:MAG: hypothetical protein MI810_21595 [Flavobacteriales bacterium]|nr:hypothetical protein [Flavobacteriales bacterium]